LKIDLPLKLENNFIVPYVLGGAVKLHPMVIMGEAKSVQTRDYQDILKIEFEAIDLRYTLSIRQYLKELLKTLWKEGEEFSGKRPFGNSGWQYEIYEALARNGLVASQLDKDGFLIKFDKQVADELVLRLIEAL
jgi:hypothetical protein